MVLARFIPIRFGFPDMVLVRFCHLLIAYRLADFAAYIGYFQFVKVATCVGFLWLAYKEYENKHMVQTLWRRRMQ